MLLDLPMLLNLQPTVRNEDGKKYISPTTIFNEALYKSKYLSLSNSYREKAKRKFMQKLYENKDLAIFDVTLFHIAFDKLLGTGSIDLLLLFDKLGYLRDRSTWKVIKNMWAAQNPVVQNLYQIFNALYGIQFSEAHLPGSNGSNIPDYFKIHTKTAILTNPCNYKIITSAKQYTGTGNDFGEVGYEALTANIIKNKYLQLQKGTVGFENFYNGIKHRLEQDADFKRKYGKTNYEMKGELYRQIAQRAGIILRGWLAEYIVGLYAGDLVTKQSGTQLNGDYEYGADFKYGDLNIEVKNYRTSAEIVLTGANKYHNADYVLCLIRNDILQYPDNNKGPGKVGPNWRLLQKIDKKHYRECELNELNESLKLLLSRLNSDQAKELMAVDLDVSLDKTETQFDIYSLS